MGTWSHEPFGNDTACDWGYGLLETQGLSWIESALDAVLENGDAYLEADLATEAVAAVEVLAKLMGRGSQTDAYTQKVDEWVRRHPQKPPASVVEKARNAIARIRSPESELQELWEEGKGTDAWKQSLEQLLAAMRG